MLPLIGAILVSSVLGSLHCAGMCGAFLALAIGTDPAPAAHARLQGAYHAGRLVTYLTLGTLAGALGSAVDLSGSLLGVQRLAAVVAGAFMVAFGALAVARSLGWKIPRLPLPRALVRLGSSAHSRAMSLPGLPRAWVIGLLTTLLPCGWLWAFVVAAAGTGSWPHGAMAMGAFWLGTLPALVALGTGLTRAVPRLSRVMPLATSIVIVITGLASLAGRLPALRPLPADPGSLPVCHGD